jgi:hypothetical protein
MIVHLAPDIRPIEKNCVNDFAPLHPAFVEPDDLYSSQRHFRTKELGTTPSYGLYKVRERVRLLEFLGYRQEE